MNFASLLLAKDHPLSDGAEVAFVHFDDIAEPIHALTLMMAYRFAEDPIMPVNGVTIKVENFRGLGRVRSAQKASTAFFRRYVDNSFFLLMFPA